MYFKNIYQGKKVFVTGHTGFKGSWLLLLLKKLGANVVGLSDCIPTTPSLFETAKLGQLCKDYRLDILQFDELKKIMLEEKPDFVFHLAAQPIVATSQKEPLRTLSVNAMGTAHILEALRSFTHPCTAVMITSDKCYENVEWVFGYKETDTLGGKDIYSASKAAAENIFHAYTRTYFENHSVRLCSARAGNVIGGGDWALHRIVADMVRSWSENKSVVLRSPNSTRPWQHVLEPLSGYLQLGAELYQNKKLHGESFNFGPRAEQNKTVKDICENLARIWGFADTAKSYSIQENKDLKEAGLLKLNCDKALFHLHWQACLDYAETVQMVGEWYTNFYQNKEMNMKAFTQTQIEHYFEKAKKQKLAWTQI
jgi:CDP-glucose 4,6-dehydratase